MKVREIAEQVLAVMLASNHTRQVNTRLRSTPAHGAGAERLDPARIGSFVLTSTAGQRVPLDQIGRT
jgi:hypothetical protein